MEEIKSVVTEINKFEKRKISLLAVFENLENQDSDARVIVKDFTIGATPTTTKRSLQTFMEKINPVVS